jgi:hypothetical protein
MRTITAALLVVALAACSTPKSKTTGLTDGSIAHTVSCQSGWDECYLVATKLCGSSRFTELDRVTDGSVSSAGHLARRHTVEGGIENHVYSENPREEVFQHVLTFRCEAPNE